MEYGASERKNLGNMNKPFLRHWEPAKGTVLEKAKTVIKMCLVEELFGHFSLEKSDSVTVPNDDAMIYL